jgi:multicomponent Na+:H+ antiporter subunit B
VSPTIRRVVFLVSTVGVAIFLVWGGTGLPRFGRYRGPYGDVILRSAIPERHVGETVTSVVLDYRGLDTLGEEFILFAAAVGVALLLRAGREEEESDPERQAGARERPPPAEAARVLGFALVGPTVLVGASLVAHGHLTPGGGFQGGLVAASALMLVFLTGRYLAYRRVSPIAMVDLAKGTGMGGYVAIGLLGLALGSAFLANVLGLGSTGDLVSGGTIPVLNVTVGLGVAAGIVLTISEFLEQTLLIHRRGGP